MRLKACLMVLSERRLTLYIGGACIQQPDVMSVGMNGNAYIAYLTHIPKSLTSTAPGKYLDRRVRMKSIFKIAENGLSNSKTDPISLPFLELLLNLLITLEAHLMVSSLQFVNLSLLDNSR